MIIDKINKRRSRNSVKLSTSEHAQLKEHYTTFHTDLDFAESFGINRVTLKRILFYGSGNEVSIRKIQKVLKKAQATKK
jgi:hypothetical protein